MNVPAVARVGSRGRNGRVITRDDDADITRAEGRVITREEVALGPPEVCASGSTGWTTNPPLPIDSIPAPVIVVSEHGEIVFANSRAEALFGHAWAEIAGRPFTDLVPDHLVGRDDERRRHDARHKNGTELSVELSTCTIADGSVIMIHDVTARRERERMCREAVTYLSHDIRNPLAAILGETELLRRGRLDAPRAEHAIRVITRNAAALGRLVSEVLDLAHRGARPLELRRSPTDLARLLEEVTAGAMASADRDRLRLELHARPLAWIDAARIERVIVNLIHNARKYAPDGTITVQLEAREAEAIVRVIDQGPGLSPDDAAHVFEKYRRASRAPGGFGLGLFICAEIIEAHGGTIGVDTAPGEGATFFFAVPLVADERSDCERPRAGTRILVVDDDEQQAAVLAELLRDEGLAATSTSSPRQALALHEACPLDAVVVDVGMSDMSGPDLLAALRTTAPELPALLVSGYEPHDPRIATTLDSGHVRYVAKPAKVSELLSAVACLLERP